ncbi:hypothetical protein N7450_003947 [Penicillium hetheringtonii]|uniref:Uncharacterized protein n=1 Tax=Penicillium hetheringtonii TaxID=911720 RepID=A0AAD6DPW3_9EURO|nr:hypothetical protein N7450_003947 [Penicillium hetheringtonii]
MIRELLIRPGRQHLLVIPKDVDCDTSKFEEASFAEVEVIEPYLKQYIDKRIESCLKSLIIDRIVVISSSTNLSEVCQKFANAENVWAALKMASDLTTHQSPLD